MLRNEGDLSCVLCDEYNEIGRDNHRAIESSNNKSGRRHKHNPLDDILLTMSEVIVNGHESNACSLGSSRSIDSMVKTRPSITTFEKEQTNFECCSTTSACNNFSCSIPRNLKTKHLNYYQQQQQQSILCNSFDSMTSSSKVCSLSSALSTISSSKSSASLISRTSVQQTSTKANNNSVPYSCSLPDDCSGNYCQQCSQSVCELVIADQHQQQESYRQKKLLSPVGLDQDEREVKEELEKKQEDERLGDISAEQDLQLNQSFDVTHMDKNNPSLELKDEDNQENAIGLTSAVQNKENIQIVCDMIDEPREDTRALSAVSASISTDSHFKLFHLFKKFIALFHRKSRGRSRSKKSKKLKGNTTVVSISSPLNWRKQFMLKKATSTSSSQKTKNKLTGSFRYFLQSKKGVPEEVALAFKSYGKMLPFGWYDTRYTTVQKHETSQWPQQYPRLTRRQQMLELFNRQHRYLTRMLSKQKFGVSKMFQQLDARKPRPNYQFLNRLLYQGEIRNRMSGYRYNLIRPIFLDETPYGRQAKIDENLDILLNRLHLSHCQQPSASHTHRLTKSDESYTISNWKMEGSKRRLPRNIPREPNVPKEEDCLECLISRIQHKATSRKEKCHRKIKLKNEAPFILLEEIDEGEEDVGSMICCDCAFTSNQCCGQQILNNSQAYCPEVLLLETQKVPPRLYNPHQPTSTRPLRRSHPNQLTSKVYNHATSVESRVNKFCGDNRYGQYNQQWTSRDMRTRPAQRKIVPKQCYCVECTTPAHLNTFMVANL